MQMEQNMNIYQHKVQYYETDKMGIVHHSNYIRWMEEARIDFLSQVGWDLESLEDMGVVSPVISVESKYICTTKFPEVISIEVWVEEFRGVKLKLGYEMRREDVVVNRATSEHCFLKADGSIVNVKREYPAFYETLCSLAEERQNQSR